MVEFQEKLNKINSGLEEIAGSVPKGWDYHILNMEMFGDTIFSSYDGPETPELKISVWKKLEYDSFTPESALKYVTGKEEYQMKIKESFTSPGLAMELLKEEADFSVVKKELTEETEDFIYEEFNKYLSKDLAEKGIKNEICKVFGENYISISADTIQDCEKADTALKELGLVFKE